MWFEPLPRRPRTVTLVVDDLRRRIAAGEFEASGQLPTQVELAGQYDVSRPTMGEAFQVLIGEGLLAGVRRSGGVWLLSPSAAEAARHVGQLLQIDRVLLADVYQARAVLEPAAAELLALRRTDDDLLDLAECVIAL